MPPRIRTSPKFLILLVETLFFASIALAADSIPRSPVETASLASVGYDEQARVLEIEFRNGGIYRYSGVTKEFFSQFMTANSKGRFFTIKIRGRFPFSKVNTNSIAGQ